MADKPEGGWLEQALKGLIRAGSKALVYLGEG